MKNVINVDFRKRMVISGPSVEATARQVQIDTNSAPSDIFEKFDHSIQCIEARFGDEMPDHGPIYKQSLKGPIFDTYGHGCVHNSIHQYQPKSKDKWNRPYPFPADLRALDTYLKKNSGRVLKLGQKSDPFMWLDLRYQITKAVLQLANKYNVSLMIHTMSDLCAHDEYLDLLSDGDHTIVMHMGFEDSILLDDERIEHLVSPGAPSLKRRYAALTKLKERNIDHHIERTKVSTLTKAQLKKLTQLGIDTNGEAK